MSEHNEHQGDAPNPMAAMKHQVGPLPMWGWIAALVGGLGIAWYARTRSGASAGTSAATDTTATNTTGTGNDWDYGTSNGVGQDTSATGTGASITTNEEWQTQAVTVLVGRLYDPVSADRAIGDYLAGNPLTTVERAIVSEAILAIGPPPVSPPPPPTADAPPVTVTPAPPAIGTGNSVVGTPTPPIVANGPITPPTVPASVGSQPISGVRRPLARVV